MSQPSSTWDSKFLPRTAARSLGLALILTIGITTTGLAQGKAPAEGGDRRVPVAVWPPGPLEVIAAFDRPLTPEDARSMVGRTIPYDDAPADRPGSPRDAGQAGRLRIVGARLMDDGRTLVLATDPHPRPAIYHLPLPVPAGAGDGARASVPYTLSGAEAAWSEGVIPAGEPNWSGWWPLLDLDATRRLTEGSRPHEAGWKSLARSGRLVLSAWIQLPPGPLTFRIRSSSPIEEVMLGDAQGAGQAPGLDDTFRADLPVESRGEPLFLTATVRTGNAGRPLEVKASYRMAGQAVDHAIDRDHLRLPWAPTSTAAATEAPIAIPDVSGGDPGRGRAIFRGDQARCGHCHAFRGEGGQVGPDLTDIASKGRAEIYRSIAAPSAAIAPDYTTYTVATRDGQVLAGVVRAEGPDEIKVTDTNARSMTVRRDRIQEIRPSATSIMPPGLAAALGESAVRDLLAYLTSPAK